MYPHSSQINIIDIKEVEKVHTQRNKLRFMFCLVLNKELRYYKNADGFEFTMLQCKRLPVEI